MKPMPSARRQSGAALMIFALILVLGTSWMLVSALNNASSDRNTTTRTQSGSALKQAKEGLIGYVITQAASSSNAIPGKFPCPENPANPGTANEGVAATSCTLPAVGRLPWRTIGIDKLTDGSGEPLWYVLSSGWTGTAGSIKINSDTLGNLTLDGTANAAIALIIAPGAPMALSPNANQIAAGCVARTQARDAKFSSGPPDLRDYLECENATSPADATFVSSVVDNATNAISNDQVAAITVSDIMPALDGVIAKRIEADIAAAIASEYGTAAWNGSGSAKRFPFAASFTDTSYTFKGVVGNRGGLLPVTYSQQPGGTTDCVSASDSRCDPTFVAWNVSGTLAYTAPLPITTSGIISTISVPTSSPYITATIVANSTDPGGTTRGTLTSLNCSASTSTTLRCTVGYGRACTNYNPPGSTSTCGSRTETPRIRLTARALNVARAVRTFDVSGLTVATFQSRTTATSYGASPLGILRSDGDADITTEWVLPSKSCTSPQTPSLGCGTSTGYTITIPISLLADHAIINTSSPQGWFVANDWHKVTYFAIGSGSAPGGTGTCSGASCLTVTGGSAAGALLVYAGRDLLLPVPNPARRPNSTLSHYLEGANAAPDDTYETRSVSSTFNDRLVRIYP